MRHTRYGYWLEEAGPVEPTRAARRRHDGRRRHRRGRLPRPLDGVAAEGARARTRRRRARGGARRARAERTERRLRLDALGRPADPARQRRRHARRGGVPGVRTSACTGSAPGARRRGSTRGIAPAATLQVATSEAQLGDWDERRRRRARRSARPRRPCRSHEDEVRARAPRRSFSAAGCCCERRRTSSRPGCRSGCAPR